jgi:hypothetical protein
VPEPCSIVSTALRSVDRALESVELVELLELRELLEPLDVPVDVAAVAVVPVVDSELDVDVAAWWWA